MTLDYYRTTKVYHGEYEDFDEGYNFEYKVEGEQLADALVDVIIDDKFECMRGSDCWARFYIAMKKAIRALSNDTLEKIAEDYYDELHSYFKDDAFEQECNE